MYYILNLQYDDLTKLFYFFNGILDKFSNDMIKQIKVLTRKFF